MADTFRLRDRSRAARRRGPVFVDSSGRSLGRVRLIGGIALAAVAGYVVLLVVAVLGGPNVAAPYLLQPPVSTPEAAPTPASPPAPSPASGTASAADAEAASAVVAAPVVAQPAPAPAPTAQAPATAAPVGAAPAATAVPGKSDLAPGQQDTRPTSPAKP